MPKNAASSLTSTSTPSSSDPTKLPDQDTNVLDRFRKSKEAEKTVQWVNEQYSKSKSARQTKQLQWYTNLAFFFGKHYVEQMRTTAPEGYRDRLTIPKSPYYKRRKTINRVRSFVRAEHSKFMSSVPNAVVVPSTAEDQDIRAAYAGEQAWKSISEAQRLRAEYSKAVWWTILSGNGFIKTHWDQQAFDKATGEQGAIRFDNVSPFNLFIPDLREQDIEDQPWVQYATIRPLEWCYTYFERELNGRRLKPTVVSQNSIVEEGHLNLSTASSEPDSCIVYETWVKPGADKRWPDGAVIISVDNILLQFYEGFPYQHHEYPFTKFEHIQNSTFYADSPLVDLLELQKEYNELRTDIAEAARRMGRPQLLVQRGSLSSHRLTNESGLIVEYKQGTPAPQPLQLSPLPQYLIEQQDRILTDFEDISGQHEVSKGSAPPGVTAGTAIAYLQEKDDQYLTSQYNSIEDGYAKLARQSLQLFVQYVDLPRKIKTIGADGAFDTVLLSGSDLKNATDVRIEGGSAIGQSKAANDARVMDMFAMGIIDQPTALRLIEIGGSAKVLDLLHVAERKAQRENIKMKMLKPEQILQHEMQWAQEQQFRMMLGEPPEGIEDEGPVEERMMGAPPGEGPSMAGPIEGAVEGPPPAGMGVPAPQDEFESMGPPPAPPIIAVDDFDVHAIHIETHNKFRMSQEYEALPDEVKEQFALHVELHEQQMFMQQQVQGMMAGGMGAEGAPAPGTDPGAGGGQLEQLQGMLAGNGAAPDMAPEAPGGGES
jgi:hypothetical protein